ncbi:MAG: hypothetical protein JWQ34_1386 [Mucilaginibacter sp.]|uniref:hypothetical protein n=1 Tax=Mucilaginibacter sp. TaxID=1882438 RepID=UPI0026130C97|nr:hypothetical protein [Mucilaginibacter sp.]MDB5003161.1 hypothetical protein [Mucilaginibacter sp.]
MKKMLSIACAALVVAALASCKKTYVTNVNPAQTYTVTVAANSWAQTKDGKSDSVSLKAPAIDDFFNNNGATLVYFSFFKGVYEQIPEVYNNVSYSYFHYVDSQGGHLILYSQPITGAPVKPTSDIVVKLVLVPSS